jgi:hypothetical protein
MIFNSYSLANMKLQTSIIQQLYSHNINGSSKIVSKIIPVKCTI